jgi:hypothetical protein
MRRAFRPTVFLGLVLVALGLASCEGGGSTLAGVAPTPAPTAYGNCPGLRVQSRRECGGS